MVDENFEYYSVGTNNMGSSVKYCSVTLKDVISRGKRLEASVFDVEAKQARSLIENGKYPLKTVGGQCGIADSYVCGRFKRIWVEKSDIPIFQPSSITDIHPDPDGYISCKTKTDIEALRVHKGQVLMTCSGTIGKLAYVSKTLDGKVFSHDLLRINTHRPSDAGYLYTYLKSKIGNKILLTNSYGAVITHIEPDHLSTIPIPDAPLSIKNLINDYIEKSFELRDESNDLFDRATDLLKKELHLPDLKCFAETSCKEESNADVFSVKLSDLEGRIDASYHIPVVDAIINHMKKYALEVTTVGDIRVSKSIVLPPRFTRVYVDEGYGSVLIGGKQIHELDPSGKKYLSKSKHKDLMKKLEVYQNTILITRSGTIGKVALVPKHWNHWIPSDHIIRVFPESDRIAGYLSVFLSSEYGLTLIKRYTYGSVVDEIDDKHVASIPFPILKNGEVQNEINDLALKANEKRYEAYVLEQKALEVLEKEVLYSK